MRSHHAGGVEVRETVLCRAKISTGGKQKARAYLPSMAIVICDVFWWSEPMRCCARGAARESILAHTAPRLQTVQGRGRGARQQDGAHRLGVTGQGRHLSGACGGGVKICDTTIGTRAATNQTGAGMARSDIADVYHLPIIDEEERGVIVAGKLLGKA